MQQSVGYSLVYGELYANGIRCVASEFVQPVTERKQIKFPKSKKARIRRKWAKRPENWIIITKEVFYMIGNTVLLNPKHYEQLLASFPINN